MDKEEIKEREIERLKSRLSPFGMVKAMLLDPYGFDAEPKPGILSDDEVLFYAPSSRTASRIRLNRGTGSFFQKIWDKQKARNFYLSDSVNKTNVKSDKHLIYKENLDELKEKYESKEKIVRILIKEYFPPPQITYDKFISEIDNWCDVFNNQYNLGLNLLNIENTSKISGKYMNILNILNLIIEKTEDLVIELTVQSNKQNNDEKMNEILIKMQDVVNSVKEYKI